MPQWISELIVSSPFLGGLAVAGFLIFLAWKYLRPPTRGIEHFLEDWNGEPERPGVPARPGMMQRVSNIEASQQESVAHQTKSDAWFEKYGPIIDKLDHEMHPNSGSSMADAVNRTEKALQDHIAACPAVVQTTVNVSPTAGAA